MKHTVILFFAFFIICQARAQSTTSESAAAISAVDSPALYGLSPELPIKVGGTYASGVANQRKYLESLRDAQGKRITYTRKGSCCSYRTENGFEGFGRLDQYEVKYRDARNKKKKVILYISFYDYEDPKAVNGFTLE